MRELEGFPIPALIPHSYSSRRDSRCSSRISEAASITAPNSVWRVPSSRDIGDLNDIMTGIDSLIDQGIADPDRLGVMGWSYGGFLTAWIVGHSNRFKAASIGACSTDWMSWYGASVGGREGRAGGHVGLFWRQAAGTIWKTTIGTRRVISSRMRKHLRSYCTASWMPIAARRSTPPWSIWMCRLSM